MGIPLKWCTGTGAIAIDHSFLRKSGKKPPGLSFYWSGCAPAVKRELAVNVAQEVTDIIQEETWRKLSITTVKKILHNIELYQHIKVFIYG